MQVSSLSAKRSKRPFLFFFLSFFLVCGIAGFPVPGQAAPSSELWDYWSSHDPDSTLSIDHSDWDAFQKKYTHLGEEGIRLVDYGKVTEADKVNLGRYIENLAGMTVTGLNRPEQMAYWINLYNALTVNVILDHYPVKSIRDIDISPGLFSDGPWEKPLVAIEGHDVSLDDIEHRILRPIWKDPRIHYAVNCAALGCPNLIGQAFMPDKAEQILETAAREFVNHPRGVNVSYGNIDASSIYKWFQEDFGDSEQGVLQHLSRYAEDPLLDAVTKASSIKTYNYDWALNDSDPKKPKNKEKKDGRGGS